MKIDLYWVGAIVLVSSVIIGIESDNIWIMTIMWIPIIIGVYLMARYISIEE